MATMYMEREVPFSWRKNFLSILIGGTILIVGSVEYEDDAEKLCSCLYGVFYVGDGQCGDGHV